MFKVWSPYGFNTDFDPISIVRLHRRGVDAAWLKQASAADSIFGKEFDEYELEPGHSLIHLAPVAASEVYSCNVNGDGFKQAACRNFHETFLAANKFLEHDNQDPKKGTGRPVKTAYNEKLARIELLVDIVNKKNDNLLQKLASGQPVDWSMACAQHKNTPVMTESGWAPIAKIRLGDKVLTHRSRFRRVTALLRKSYTGRIVHLKAKGIPIPLAFTGDHPFMAMKRTAVPVGVGAEPVDDIGGRSLDARWYRFRKNNPPKAVLDLMDWTQAGDLQNGDKGMIVTGQRPLRHPVIEDENFAQLLGIYMAEGSYGKNQIRFDIHKDDAARTFIPELCEIIWGKRPSDHEHQESDQARTLTLSNKKAQQHLAKYIGRRLKDKQIPPEITAASRRVQSWFVGRWLDGDGWYDEKGAHWSIAKLHLALELRDLLLRLGMAASIYRIKHSIEQDSYSNNYEYTVNLPQADAKLLSPFSSKLNKVDRWRISQRGKSAIQPAGDGRAVCTFVDVQDSFVENEIVYDISVEDDESFVAAGVVVHNCKIDYDECNVPGCGNRATSPHGPCDQSPEVPSPGYCKHAKNGLGALLDDGHRIFVDNPHPHYFDISETGMPAEVLARTMQYRKAASVGACTTSGADFAAQLGLGGPIVTRASLPTEFKTKLSAAEKIAEIEKQIPMGGVQEFKYVVAGTPKPDDATRTKVKDVTKKCASPDALFRALRDEGVILDIVDFAAVTDEPNEVVVKAAAFMPMLFSYLNSRSLLHDTASNGTFDNVTGSRIPEAVVKTAKELAPNLSLEPMHVRHRLIEADTVKVGSFDIPSEEPSGQVETLMRKYAAYILSEVAAKNSLTFNRLNVLLPLTALSRVVNYR